MTDIAVDICLLPPEHVQDLCITAHQKAKNIRPLGKDDYIPHITLAMGVIEEQDLHKIELFLQNVTINPLSLSANSIRYNETPEGNKSSIAIEKTSQLQELHETIMSFIKPFLKKEVADSMLYKHEETGVTESTKTWLRTYSEETSYEKYWPHITLNSYDAIMEFPLVFTVNTLALCHVGDGVTCRKILFTRSF